MEASQVAQKVSREELLDITQAILRVPSLNPPGDVRDCAELIVRILAREGIEAWIVPASDGLANVVARLEGKGPGPTLLLGGHLDVVPAGADWTHDPWGAEFVDGRIYGRGASDMKGGLAAMMGTLFALKRAGCPFKGKVLFAAAADEETGSDAGTVYLLEKKVIQADFAIVGEPTTRWVEIGNTGLVWLEATIKGKASHACYPHLGINAIHDAASAIVALNRLEFPERQEIFEVPTGGLSITMINGGTKLNTVPDRCTLGLDRRLLPGNSAEQAVEEIRQAIVGALSAGAALDLRVIKVWPAVITDINSVLVRSLASAFEKVMACKPQTRGKRGSTDASFINATLGIPVVLFGPGASPLCHCADEYVELEEIVKTSHIYTLTALELLPQ